MRIRRAAVAALACALALPAAGAAKPKDGDRGNGHKAKDEAPSAAPASAQQSRLAEPAAATPEPTRIVDSAIPDLPEQAKANGLRDRAGARATPTASALPTFSGSTAAPTASAPLASTAAPIVTAPATTPAATREAARRQARRRAAARRRSAATRPSGAGAAPVVSTVPAAGPIPRDTDTPAAAASPRAPRPSAGTTPGAEVDDPRRPIFIPRTITEFVEVVPQPLRILVGALAAVALGLMAAVAAAALRARAADQRRRRLADDVGLLQSALLPVIPAEISGAAISAAYRPADGPVAGGDFFDAFPVDDHRIALLVGDVGGHGRHAVPLTASVRYTVRAYLEAGLEPRQALQVAGAVLADQLRGRMVTVVAAVFDSHTNRLTYSCAGHPLPVLIGSDHQPLLACASPPLGAGAPTGRRQSSVTLAPGTAVCFHTDGLMDLRRAGARLGMAGLAERLRAIVPGRDAAQALAELTQRGDHRPDDMALCILRVPETARRRPAPAHTEEMELTRHDLGSRGVAVLAACGVRGAVAEAALDAAGEVADRHGTVLLHVEMGARGTTSVTAVHPPAPELSAV